MKHLNKEAGQSIIEVLFATLVVALVLVAVLSTIITSFRNARISLEQSRSTKYASEVNEWLRRHRDAIGWQEFAEVVGPVGAAGTYCLPIVPNSFDSLAEYATPECDVNQSIEGTDFYRELNLNRISEEEVESVVTVYRPGRAESVPTVITNRFSKWQ